MNIKQKDNHPKNGYFEATIDSARAGVMTYTWLGDQRIRIDHTEVKEAFSGKGVGKKILMEVIDTARRKSLKIVPECPFVRGVFKKDASIQDVLDRDEVDF